MIKIKNIMTKEVIAIQPDARITDAANLITSKSVSSLVVVEKGKPIAIINENDVIRGILSKKTKVKDVMSKHVIYIKKDDPLLKVESIMKLKDIARLPVVDSRRRLIGILTKRDIFRALVGKYF